METFPLPVNSENNDLNLHQFFGVPLDKPHTLEFSKTTIEIKKKDGESPTHKFSNVEIKMGTSDLEYFTLKCYDDNPKTLNLSVYFFTNYNESPKHLEEISSYMTVKPDKYTLNLVVLFNVPKRHINCVKYIFAERFMKYSFLHDTKDEHRILMFVNPNKVQIKIPGENICDSDIDTTYEISRALYELDKQYKDDSTKKLIELIEELEKIK